MSEGANVRQNLQNVPSIFEITAAENLDNLIYPALSKVFDYFGLRLDFKLWRNIRLREEISPIFTWLLQYLYLRNRAASFGESFYGLQRTATATGALLTRREQLASATILTLLPYVERKLKTRSAQHEQSTNWEKYLLNILHAYNASKSVHIFLYLIKYASSHSSIFRALRLTLRYPETPASEEDKTTYVFLKVVEVLAFFLQFINWWYSSDQRRKLGGSLQNPPALDETANFVHNSNIKNGECPICLMKIETPTACAISGYVYCWKCIANHLKSHSTCPVTGYEISLEDLVRVYET